jgi:AraC-like DNA-binding protein
VEQGESARSSAGVLCSWEVGVDVIYFEHRPAPPLDRFVRSLWYVRAPDAERGLERVLPTGHAQVILNLERDYLTDCPEGQPKHRMAPALVIGARSIYEVIDRSDMADLIGIVFQPGGFAPFAGDAVDRFSNRNWALEDLWGTAARSLRDELRELPGPRARIRRLEQFLLERFAPRLDNGNAIRNAALRFALGRFERAPALTTVCEVARSTGWSERRFSQVFREEVGFSPKVWCRIRRFQRVVERLYAGVEIPWAELALNCGFYDQSHFANEFRAFSGIDATTYTSLRATPWANHLPVE